MAPGGAALVGAVVGAYFLPVLPQGLYLFGVSVTAPSLTLRILDLFPARRGLVSSCQSATQTGINAVTASILAPLLWDSTLTLALAMVGFLLLGLAAFGLRASGGRRSRGPG